MRLAGHRLLLTSAVILGAVACGPFDRSDVEVVALLWLPQGTQLLPDDLRPRRRIDGRGLYIDGSASVMFASRLTCDEFAQQVSERFPTAIWHPTSTQFGVPPGSPTAGHLCYNVDSTSPLGPGSRPFWVREWENASGEVVSFSVREEMSALRGEAVYLSRPLAEQIRSRRLKR